MKSTVFRRGRRQTSGVQKNMRGFYDKVEMRRPKFIVAVVKILCSSCKFW